MTDTGITKSIISKALKELMKTLPFQKVTVGSICEKCDINRKTFYYHFKDKYDLINRSFDTELLHYAADKESAYEFLFALCDYMCSERVFYVKAFRIDGQDSFTNHFTEFMGSVVDIYVAEAGGKATAFEKEYIAVANTKIFAKYLEKPFCTPNELTSLLDSVIRKIILSEKLP